MKYTIHVNQAGADQAGLRDKVDIIDLAVFDAFKDFANSNRCEKLVDVAGRVWFWIDYSLIVDELPYCGLNSKDSVYRRMRKLAEAKIIEFHPDNQKMGRSFFSWAANYDILITTTKPTDEYPKGPKDLRTTIRRGTDDNPKGYGRQSEAPSDRKPNYPNTKNQPTNHLTKPDSAATATVLVHTIEMVEVETDVEDGKKATASKGAGPQTKSWTRQAAEAFDEIAIEKCTAHRVDYQPFNWSVCQEENFRQLRMLREKAIGPDFKTKHNADPTEEQVMASFRAVFRLAWEYFYKIQKEKGGALHYTPTSIYKSYNSIKTTAKNGNINGITTANGSAGTHFKSGVDHTGSFDPTRGY